MGEPILLSPPHLGSEEQLLVVDALTSNWVAPVGPHVDAFEREFASSVGAAHAAAVSSGTAALHLALRLLGVGSGDVVFVSTLTFAASVFPIRYLGATPHFIDSERTSWNMDPEVLVGALEAHARQGRLPAAVVVVHLYGQSADLGPILDACSRWGVPVVEDAAEALGARHGDASPGTLGAFGIYSFNGNKMITTSGGGMLVTADADAAARTRNLAAQARQPVRHYEHQELGYNYRLSNVLAAIGRAQLRMLGERVTARRRNFRMYQEALGGLPGLTFMPEAPWGTHCRWLTTLTIDEDAFGATRDDVLRALEADRIEARPLWKPMHEQPVFQGYGRSGGAVAEDIFRHGLCLPSGSALRPDQLERICSVVRQASPAGVGS